ncbi:MAG TPA: hypothetical protein EYP90_08285, partial [Chromatiaceae bacterium]|nr:hypothetical protein [Chromatiaceae bacterium]
MNGFGNKLLLVLPVLMLLAPAGYAAYDTPAGLLAAYENMKCKTDFTIDLIEDMADKIPEAEYLTEYSDALDSHMDELKSLAEDGDKRAYRSYMSENLRPAFTDAKEGIREARGNFREWNVSLETKLDLLD